MCSVLTEIVECESGKVLYVGFCMYCGRLEMKCLLNGTKKLLLCCLKKLHHLATLTCVSPLTVLSRFVFHWTRTRVLY